VLHASRPRIALVAALIALVVLTALAGAPSATAASSLSCAEQIVDDWYGDGRVDKIYPLKCYQAAIRSLPVDVLDYSRAEEDILRALQYARAGEPDPGPTGGAEPNDNDPGDETTPGTGGGGDPSDPGGGGEAAENVDTSGPSSVPIPLIVLGGLALLLLAAGAVGYLSRRAQARHPGDPPGPA
jgi:hypothetical protein